MKLTFFLSDEQEKYSSSVALQSTDIPFRGNNKPLMTGPEGNSQFCFPRISMFPEAKPRKTSRFVICYIAGDFEAGNSLNLAVTAVVDQHSRVTVHCYPLTSYILQLLLAQRFWRETVSLLDVM